MNQFQSWYRIQPKALRALLTINVVLYVLWILILGRIEPVAAFFFNHLALGPRLPDVLMEPWQLVTYNFLHLGGGLGGFLHVLFNMLWLVWIGREYEELHGAHRLLALYLITGVGGGLLTVFFYALFAPPSGVQVVVYGASASVLGVMTAVAVKYPYKSIALLFIGTVRLIYIVLAFLVIDLLIADSSTAVMAHLGGALFGFLMVKAENRGLDLSSWAGFFFPEKQRARRQPPARGEKDSVLSRMENWLATRSNEPDKQKRQRRASVYPLRGHPSATTPEAPPIESEVDRILDKISEKGYEALTEEEKRVLYEASRK